MDESWRGAAERKASPGFIHHHARTKCYANTHRDANKKTATSSTANRNSATHQYAGANAHTGRYGSASLHSTAEGYRSASANPSARHAHATAN